MSNNYIDSSINASKFSTNHYQDSYNLDNKKNVECSPSQYNVSEVSERVRTCPKCPTIEQGLDFMLWHLQEPFWPLWPRNISTAVTRGAQKPVHDRDRAILFYQGTLRQDCRISCYPNYEEMGSITPAPRPKPSHLFIDIDLETFAGDRHKLDLALKSTLRNIKRELGGGQPTVLWSGGGFHIHQPLEASMLPIYEDLPEFKRYKNPSVQFMRYAERQLSNSKADRNHCVSFRSCMARIPGSINCKYTGEAAEVIIVQRWNGVRAVPTEQFLLTDFLIWLVQADFDARKKLRKQAQKSPVVSNSSAAIYSAAGGIGWIERVLLTPIPDWRKSTVALILAPYLITIKHMSYDQAFQWIMMWARQCAKLSSLRPNDRGFVERVHMALQRTQDKGQRPMRWVTLVENYPALHEAFKQAV